MMFQSLLISYLTIAVVVSVDESSRFKSHSTYSAPPQKIISPFSYGEIMRRLHSQNRLTQQIAVDGIRCLIRQNAQSSWSNSLDVSIWNLFFQIYYDLPRQFRPSYVCKLLSCMELPGSQCKPDLNTFQIILNGIVNEDVYSMNNNQIDVFNYIIYKQMIDNYSLRPNDEILQLQYRVYAANLQNHGSVLGFLTRLLMDNPETIFPAKTQTFNHILDYSPHYFTNQTILSGFNLIMNVIMRRHCVSYNAQTFLILDKVLSSYPQLRKLDIYQPVGIPGQQHISVWKLARRMRQIQKGVDFTKSKQ